MFDINTFICVLYYIIVWRSSHSLNGGNNLRSHPRIHMKPFFIVFSFTSIVSCNIETLTIFKKYDIALSKGSFYDIHIFIYSTMPITPLCSSLLRFLLFSWILAWWSALDCYIQVSIHQLKWICPDAF